MRTGVADIGRLPCVMAFCFGLFYWRITGEELRGFSCIAHGVASFLLGFIHVLNSVATFI